MSAQEETYWESVVRPMFGRWAEPLSADEWDEFNLWWDEYAPSIRAEVGSSPIEQAFAIALMLESWGNPVAWDLKERIVPGNWTSIDMDAASSVPWMVIRPQHTTATGNRRDFALFVWNGNYRSVLLIECDSEQWHSDWAQACDDRRRDRLDLAAGEPPIARFVGADIHRFPERTADEALSLFAALTAGVVASSPLSAMVGQTEADDAALFAALTELGGLRKKEMALAVGVGRQRAVDALYRLKREGRAWYDNHSLKWYATDGPAGPSSEKS